MVTHLNFVSDILRYFDEMLRSTPVRTTLILIVGLLPAWALGYDVVQFMALWATTHYRDAPYWLYATASFLTTRWPSIVVSLLLVPLCLGVLLGFLARGRAAGYWLVLTLPSLLIWLCSTPFRPVSGADVLMGLLLRLQLPVLAGALGMEKLRSAR